MNKPQALIVLSPSAELVAHHLPNHAVPKLNQTNLTKNETFLNLVQIQGYRFKQKSSKISSQDPFQEKIQFTRPHFDKILEILAFTS